MNRHKKLFLLLIFTAIVTILTFTTLYACGFNKAPSNVAVDEDEYSDDFDGFDTLSNKGINYSKAGTGQYSKINSLGWWLVWEHINGTTEVMKITSSSTNTIYLPYECKKITELIYINSLRGWDWSSLWVRKDNGKYDYHEVYYTLDSYSYLSTNWSLVKDFNESAFFAWFWEVWKRHIPDEGNCYYNLITPQYPLSLTAGSTKTLTYKFSCGYSYADLNQHQGVVTGGDGHGGSDLYCTFKLRRSTQDESTNAGLKTLTVRDEDGYNQVTNFNPAQEKVGGVSIPNWSEYAYILAESIDDTTKIAITITTNSAADDKLQKENWVQNEQNRYTLKLIEKKTIHVTVKATAQCQYYSKTYTFTIARRGPTDPTPGTTLPSGVFYPATFWSGMYINEPYQYNETFWTTRHEYSANVPVSCDRVTVAALSGNQFIRILYDKRGIAEGYDKNEYPVGFGNTRIHIVMLPENKGTRTLEEEDTYQYGTHIYVTIRRGVTAELTDVSISLSGTEIDGTSVSKSFDKYSFAEKWEPSVRFNYTLKEKVDNAFSNVRITAYTLDEGAIVSKPDEGVTLPFINNPPADGTHTYTVNITSSNSDGIAPQYKTYTFTITRAAPTTNTLFNVDTSQGTPSPKYSTAVQNYTISVAATVTSIKLLPNSDKKKVKYEGITEGGAVAYNPSGNTLQSGAEVIKIGLLCTAQDNRTTTKYFLTVNRAGAGALGNSDLKSVVIKGVTSANVETDITSSLTPTFNKKTLTYSINLAYAYEKVKIIPTADDPLATLSGSYNSTAGNAVGVGATSNLYVRVTAQDKVGKTEYNFSVTRENVQNNDATLFKLMVRLVGGGTNLVGTLSPAFSSSVTDYTIDVSVAVVRLEPTPTNSQSTLSGTYNSSGNSIATGGIPTLITVIVTAPAGNSKTYNITVTRSGTDATVSALQLQVGTSKTQSPLTNATFRDELSNTNFLYYGKPTNADTFDKAITFARVTVTPKSGQTISGGSFTIDKENLAVGENKITFTITAADGSAKSLYTIVIVVSDPSKSGNAYLSGMAIMWNNNRDWDITSWYSFDSAKTGPSTLPTNVHNVTVLPSMLLVPLNNMVIFKPTVSDPASSVSVISPAATSSSNGEYFFSGVTANTIYTFEVRAGNGSTTLQYNFKFITDENTVTAKEARLSWFEILDYTSLDISTAVFKPLQPGFSPTIGEYHISFPATVTNIIVNFKYGAATSYDPSKVTAKFSNKSGENTLSDGQFVMLGEGESTINITVKSPDGTVTKNYVVHITKASALASHDAAIKSLQTSSERQFSPTFNSNTINYSMTISEPSVTLYPVLNNAGARITGGTYNASGNKVALGQTVQITIIVTAEDATTTRTYTVTVTRPLEEIKSSDAFLKSLGVSIGNLDPAFTRERVEYIVLVPNGTNYIKLSPTKSSSRATLDFDNSTYLEEGNNIAYSDAVITIRIIAEDGVTTVTYVITVRQANIQLSDDAFLKALSVSVGTLTPAFDPLTTFYNVTVPSGTLYIKLTPVLNSDTASIVLEEGTYSETVNLLNIDSYTDIVVFVRAQDGMTELGYTVRVRQAASDLSNVALLAYLEVEDVEGWFFAPSNTMYDVEVENNVTSVKVTAITQHSGATLSGGFVSEETKTISLNVGANVIKITVTAEDGVTKKDYYVFVTRKVPTSLNFQLTIEVDGWTLTPEFDAKTSSYYCAVDFSAASINIIASAGLPTVIKEGSQTGTQAVEIGKNVFTIVAVVGSTEIYYVITVSRASAPLSNNANLKSLEIKNYTIAFDKNVTEYTLAVANNIALIVLKPTKDDAGATLSGTWIADGNTLSVGVNTITIIVTAANGSKKTYTVTVTRAGEDVSTDATLSNLTADVGALSPSFSPNVTSYNITVDGGFIVLTPTKANAGATISGDWVPEGNLVGYGTTVINIIVTAADGATKKTYIVRVTRDLSPDLDIGIDISVVGYTLTPTFDAPITTYELNVAANVSSIEIIASATNSATTVRYSESQTGIRTLNFGDNVFTVVAEVDGTIISYAIHVYRTSGNANLQNILLDVGTLSPKFNADTLNYNVTVPSTAEKIIVTPVKEAVGSTLSGTFNAGGNALDFGRNTITITVTSEDGTVKIYTVVVLRRTKAAEDLEAMLPEAEELLEFALGDDGGDIPSSAAFELADAIEEAQKILKGEQNASEEDIKAALDNLDKAMKKANAYKNGEEWNEGTGGSQPTSNEWYKNGKLWGAVGGGTAVVAGDIVLGVALMKRKKLRK